MIFSFYLGLFWLFFFFKFCPRQPQIWAQVVTEHGYLLRETHPLFPTLALAFTPFLSGLLLSSPAALSVAKELRQKDAAGRCLWVVLHRQPSCFPAENTPEV